MLVFFALTNLHIFNIVNVKRNLFSDECADLYIGKSNRISHELVSEIEKAHIFRKVILIDSPYAKKIKLFGNTPILRFVPHIFEIVVDCHNILKSLKMNSGDSQYSRVFINKLNVPAVILLDYFYKYNNNIQISYIEEGGGDMYMNKNMIYHQTTQWRLIFSYIHLVTRVKSNNSHYISQSDNIYLYMPELYSMDTGLLPIHIPVIDKKDQVMKSILDCSLQKLDYSAYINKCFIYFVSHNTLNNSYETDYILINTILSVIPASDFLIKEHPIAFNTPSANYPLSQYEPSVFVDRRNYMLESLYSCIDLTEKILITRGSATVLHPKYMFNQEPYVIFTYMLYSPDNITNEAKLAEDLISCYIDKSKIFIPESITDFKNVLLCLSNNTDCYL